MLINSLLFKILSLDRQKALWEKNKLLFYRIYYYFSYNVAFYLRKLFYSIFIFLLFDSFVFACSINKLFVAKAHNENPAKVNIS